MTREEEAMPGLRLEPRDEYLHPLEEAPSFNESMYFNLYDPGAGVGGFFRLGNRPNEGHAEMTICLYLPRGRVAFLFARPPISSNDAFDAGGMRFEVLEPFRDLTVAYDGPVAVLEDPLAMEDPRRAFAENPSTECSVRLQYGGIAPAFGGEPTGDGAALLPADFGRGHYEQHVAAAGTIRVGGERWAVDGHGLRDHSWGPRSWQAPWWYRWLTANFGSEFGFAISIMAWRDGRRREGGMVLADGRYREIVAADLESDWDERLYHRRIRARVRTETRLYEIQGAVRSLVPLRNRRRTPEGETLTTRISEGLTEWRCDGRVGYGLSEYLDQIVDGRPVGVA